jgi:hypothetical protein
VFSSPLDNCAQVFVDGRQSPPPNAFWLCLERAEQGNEPQSVTIKTKRQLEAERVQREQHQAELQQKRAQQSAHSEAFRKLLRIRDTLCNWKLGYSRQCSQQERDASKCIGVMVYFYFNCF